MWGRAGSAAAWDATASPSRDHTRTEGAEDMSGPVPTIEQRSKQLGDRRSKLIALGNRARMLRQRKRASLIDATLRQVTHDILRWGTQ